MHEDWIQRWDEGRIGFHETEGNTLLRRHWRGQGGRVLVPLCGKSVDMLWLARRGHAVVGAELAERAVRAFFDENGLSHERRDGELAVFASTEPPVELHCGDYFALRVPACEAVYDRAALVALPPDVRPRYAAHTDSLLVPDAARLVVTFEYDQARVQGPPFAVSADEVRGYWPSLERVDERDVIAEAPPKFRDAGLRSLTEVVWRTA